MTVPNPTPVACVVLVLALPGIVLLAHELVARATTDRAVRVVATFGVSLSVWVWSVHAAAYLYRSFTLGLWSGTVVASFAGLGIYALRRSGRRAPPPGTGEGPSRWMWLGAAAATALIAPMALGWAFHDEIQFYGHMSTASRILNGSYPPTYITFPEHELRYHYGFNTLTAAVMALTRLRVDRAIDAVTLVCWFGSFCLLWVLGERIAGRRWGWTAAPLTLLCGGMPQLCDPPADCAYCQAVSWCSVDGALINPPVLSYFFQHPWTLGIPLFVTALLVFATREEGSSAARRLLLGLLLLGLTIGQFGLFLSAAAATVVAEAVETRRTGLRNALLYAAVPAVAVVLASFVGGMLAEAPGGATMVGVSLGQTDSLAGNLRWMIATYGGNLCLGLLGVFVLARERWMIAFLVAGGIGIVMCFGYAHELGIWDIVKFSTVAQIGLGIGAAGLLARLGAPGAPRAAAWSAAAFVFVGLMGSGLYWWSFVGPSAHDVRERFAREAVTLEADDLAALDWLRRNVGPHEIVYRESFRASFGYAQWGGVSTPWTEHRAVALGHPIERLERREAMLRAPPSRLLDYVDEGVVWFVLAPGDDHVSRLIAAWEPRRLVREAARFGELRVYRVVDLPVDPGYR